MSQPQRNLNNANQERKNALANKTFFRFLFSFIAVVACVLFIILSLGMTGNVQ